MRTIDNLIPSCSDDDDDDDDDDDFFFLPRSAERALERDELAITGVDTEPTSLPSRSLGFHFHSRARRSVEKIEGL